MPQTKEALLEARNEARRFGIRFFLILALASVFAWAVSLPDRLGLFQSFLAHTAGLIAKIVGSRSPVYESTVMIPAVSLEINFECTGVYVLLILSTFLLAYPAPWVWRIAGIAVGCIALTIVNILRIAFLIRIAELRPPLFDYFHEYVWQGLFLVLVIVYAMTWVERLPAPEPRRA